MQTPKARTTSLEAPQRNSLESLSNASKKGSRQAESSEVSRKDCTQAVRQLKTSPRYLDPTLSSSNLATRASKERSPKVSGRLPTSPLSQKKHPGRVAELESQISQLGNDLKIVKDQLCSSEASKKQAERDAEESNQQLLAMCAKLKEVQKQIWEQSVACQQVCVIEPCETTHERDQTSQSELEARQRSCDLAALDEIEQLKVQLETVVEFEASQTKHSESAQTELHKLKENLVGTLLVVEEMKNQLRDTKQSKAQAQELVGETLIQLEMAKRMVETLRSDGSKAMEAYDAVVFELEKSKARVNFLEELVSNLRTQISRAGCIDSQKKADGQNAPEKEEKRAGKSTEKDFSSLKLEVEHLRSALQVAEMKYNEEQARSAKQMRNAFEIVEQIKSASGHREAELEAELRKSKYEIEELRANLMDKETELQGICEENDDLILQLENSVSAQREREQEELQKLKAEIENLKASLMEKETEWRSVSEENETLKLEINEISKNRISDEVLSDLEAARAAEREALMRLGYMTEEADKSNRKVARVTEQLEAEQAANAEMEAELRRLKVQSDQWRKAAEAATSMLSPGNNGHLIDRTGSMDSSYCPRTRRITSPYSDDLDEDLLKKKHANRLSRFGVLWKKQHK